MSNNSAEYRTLEDTMTATKKNLQANVPDEEKQQECGTMHTCACGEKHIQTPGSPSHRDACASPLKYGNSCCCGSGPVAKNAHRCCGHDQQNE